MLAQTFRPTPILVPNPRGNHASEPVDRANCVERYLLRAEYIRRLAAFNQATVRYNLVTRAGVSGPAAQKAWTEFQDACAASREAWARYKHHVSGLSTAA